jgi:hypothetical protein
MELEAAFFGLIFGLFIGNLSQYVNQIREVDKLWIQEIVYDEDPINKKEELKLTNRELEISEEKTKLTKEKAELFSKIESLTKDVASSSDIMAFMFSILCISFLAFSAESILSLKILNSNNHNFFDQVQLIAPAALYTILYISLPKILKYSARIDILHPYKTSKIDEKLFDVWYKHRCFEHKNPYFRTRLEPIRLYKILAEKYKNKKITFDGKYIEIPEDIKAAMEKQGLFRT